MTATTAVDGVANVILNVILLRVLLWEEKADHVQRRTQPPIFCVRDERVIGNNSTKHVVSTKDV